MATSDPADRSEQHDAAERGPRRPIDPMAAVARWAPWIVLLYCAALASLRLSLSPYLELDEAQFLGLVEFRLVYDNSHPPLMNWLVRIALELTRWNWPLAMAIVKYGLLAVFHIMTFDAARRLGGPRAGVLALVASAFLPQIVWMSAHTLAHSLLTMAGVAATLQATIALRDRKAALDYVWLGVAIAMGALGKYNYYFFAIPFFAVMLLEPNVRAALWSRRALWTVGVVLLSLGPTLVAAALSWSESVSRLSRLYAQGELAWLDLPHVGVDGLLAFLIAALAWLGPAVLVWTVARNWDRAQSRSWRGDAVAERALRRVLLGAVGLSALAVFAADVHWVEERYLTPVLAAAPVYLAAAWPLGRSAAPTALLAAALYAAVLPGFWAMATYGQHRYGYPYELVAAQILRAQPEPARIISERHDDRANLTLALGWPGARSPAFQDLGDRAILVWRGRSEPPEKLAPQGFGPAAGIVTVVAPLVNESGAQLVYRFQIFERSPALGRATPTRPGPSPSPIAPSARLSYPLPRGTRSSAG
ncbi:MAG: glycosyltransferase family 39 protein [Pseudomonadota bacterium]